MYQDKLIKATWLSNFEKALGSIIDEEFNYCLLNKLKFRRRGKCCVNSIKTNLLGENYGRNNFYQGGFST